MRHSYIDDEAPIAYTRAELEKLAPKPYQKNRVKAWDSFLNALTSEDGRVLLAEYGISKHPRRLSHFLAQLAHESSGFTRFEENLNYSSQRLMVVFGKRYFPSLRFAKRFDRNPKDIANRIYNDALRKNKLGNTELGDGWKYRGRGPIQITGRDSYERLSRWLGEDFVSDPELLLQPMNGLQAALWYWQGRDLNAHADKDRIGRITKLINGGYNGIEDRKRLFARAQGVWSEYPAIDSYIDVSLLKEGSSGEQVTALQLRLKELRYPVGEADGQFGEQTHIALLAFQELNGLDPDGLLGPDTRKVMARAKPRDLGAREQVTASDLKEKSPNLKKQGFLQWLGAGAMAMFGVDGASSTGAMGWLQQLGDKAGTMSGSLKQIIPFLEFAATNLFWILGLLAAAGVWWWSSRNIKDQVQAYRNGTRMEG